MISKRTILIIILFSSVFASAKEISIYSGTAYNYNEFLGGLTNTSFDLRYDTDEKQFYFHTKGIFNSGWIKISRDDLITLRSTLKKYLEWEKTATDKKVEIEKDLPNSKLFCNVVWKFGDDWYRGTYLNLEFKFFSQNTNRHQLIMHSNKITSQSNEFIDYKLETLYFDKVQVEDFLNGISADSIMKEIDKYEKSKEVDELFK